MARRKLLICPGRSLSEELAFTAVVRDLHRAYPGRFYTDVWSANPALWERNPDITPMNWQAERLCGSQEPPQPGGIVVKNADVCVYSREKDLEIIDLRDARCWPRLSSAGQPWSLFEAAAALFSRQAGVDLRLSDRGPRIPFSESEAPGLPDNLSSRITPPFWVLMPGDGPRHAANWWRMERYQKVINALKGRISFVLCGRLSDEAPPLEGVINATGLLTLRQIMKVMYAADGVLGGATGAMHLAAALPRRAGSPGRRLVIVAGGSEDPAWFGPASLTWISAHCRHFRNGNACMKHLCRQMGESHSDTEQECLERFAVSTNVFIPECENQIIEEHVIKAITSQSASAQIRVS